jgi:23S rRNA (cytidine1920-2'-O)/16S rRNA (cytidine1409-2'-O)-methyltransferase
VTIDAGWTRLELILPVIKNFLKESGQVIALLKPHYEAEKKDLVKGVLSETIAEEVKESVKEKINRSGFKVLEETKSPILGGGGNTEYLLLLETT